MITQARTVPLSEQRYPTLGDYYFKRGNRHFKITDTGNELHNDLILVHELVEEILTRAAGITEQQILEFDLWVEEEIKKGNYPEDGEPGDHPLSPYKKQHELAEIVERLMLNQLGISFDEYNNQLLNVFKNQSI